MLSKLKHVKAIAITSDGWSCNNLKAFYANCTTCHFIDDNWRLNSFVLDVSELEGRHTAINIQTHWKNKLSEWNISSESTELSIVVDGAADYAKAAREFAKSSFWCSCHRIHLICHKLIDMPEINNYYLKCKSICSFWNSSINFQREFLDKQQEISGKRKHLKCGTKVRWNTFIKMMSSILENKEVLKELSNKYKITEFSDNEWEKMLEISKKMELLTISLRILENSSVPTIHLVYPTLVQLINQFSVAPQSMASLTEKLVELDEHCSHLNDSFHKAPILFMATFLDPRTKSFHFIPNATDRKIIQENCVRAIGAQLTDLRSHNPQVALNERNFLSSIYTDAPVASNADEVVNYVNATYHTNILDKFEILKWWNNHATDFPLLSQFARRTLAIPASSAPSERVFSVVKQLAKPNRSSISAKNFSMCAFIACNKSHVEFLQ